MGAYVRTPPRKGLSLSRKFLVRAVDHYISSAYNRVATLVLTSDILESERDGGEGECGREGACHDISTDKGT